MGVLEACHSAEMIDMRPEAVVVNSIPLLGNVQALQGAIPEFIVKEAPFDDLVALSTEDQFVDVALGLFLATILIFCC